MHISKEGDPYLRALLVQAAHHVLGPWGVDSDLRRWGMQLAEHGGKRGKKRAVIAVARKLAALLHRLWKAEIGICRYGQVPGPHCRQWHSSVQI
jgi:transposase